MANDWYTRTEDIQPTGNVYIHLACHDCPGEVRLLKSPRGEELAARMLAEHKPSGCCEERQQAS